MILYDIEINPIFLKNKNKFLKNEKIIDSIIIFQNQKTSQYFLLALNLNILNPDNVQIELKTIYPIKNLNSLSLTNGFHLKNNNFLIKFYEYVPLFKQPIICESNKLLLINILIKNN